MTPKYRILALTLVFLASPALHAAATGNLEQEYQQVRKIALRDAKVKAAYEEADRKLEAKIVQLDPALAGYRQHRASEPETTAAAAKPLAHIKPATTSGGFHTTHTVAKGETLSGIASHYAVTVSALKTANHIIDEKKLAVGQVLSIPAPPAARKSY